MHSLSQRALVYMFTLFVNHSASENDEERHSSSLLMAMLRARQELQSLKDKNGFEIRKKHAPYGMACKDQTVLPRSLDLFRFYIALKNQRLIAQTKKTLTRLCG